jgi:hypothetical protein
MALQVCCIATCNTEAPSRSIVVLPANVCARYHKIASESCGRHHSQDVRNVGSILHVCAIAMNRHEVTTDAVFRNILSMPCPALPFHLLSLFLPCQAGCHMLAVLSRQAAQNNTSLNTY